jgi:hypothetical protein
MQKNEDFCIAFFAFSQQGMRTGDTSARACAKWRNLPAFFAQLDFAEIDMQCEPSVTVMETCGFRR